MRLALIILLELEVLALLVIRVVFLVDLFLLIRLWCLLFVRHVKGSILVALLREPAQLVVLGLEVGANLFAFFVLDVDTEGLVEEAPDPLCIVKVTLNLGGQVFAVPLEGAPAVVSC